jgi:hypothetical protein
MKRGCVSAAEDRSARIFLAADTRRHTQTEQIKHFQFFLSVSVCVGLWQENTG